MSAVRDTYVTKNIRNVHPDVREAVLDVATSVGVTISDVVGGALSAAWDIPYELSGERAIGINQAYSDQLNVHIPQEMAHRIWLVSRARGITESSLVQSVIADHYGLDYEPVRRGGTRRRRAGAGQE